MDMHISTSKQIIRKIQFIESVNSICFFILACAQKLSNSRCRTVPSPQYIKIVDRQTKIEEEFRKIEKKTLTRSLYSNLEW